MGSLLFCLMFTYNEIYEAYLDCYKNKKKSPGAILFRENLYNNIRILTDKINNYTYTPLPSTAFVITDPKLREVFAADFRDRVIHHLIINELLPYFEEYFIEDSFSCMPGRGTLYGVQKMASYMENCQEGWYVMKMDVKSFFMGIRKSLLSDRLDDFICERYTNLRKIDTLRYLVGVIILSDPTEDCLRIGNLNLWNILPPEKSLFSLPPDKGLPIGNLSSQMFANFYMTSLDYYIKYTLGIEYYGRYVDDFMMYGPKDMLLRFAPRIRKFTKEYLDLEISRDKFYFQPYTHGVKFIGSMIKPGRVYCGNRVRGELEKKLYQTLPIQENIDGYISSVNSYLGLIKHYSSYNIRKELLTNLPEGWEIYIKPSNEFLRVKLL